MRPPLLALAPLLALGSLASAQESFLLERTILPAPTVGGFDRFATSLAADGDTLLVGAFREGFGSRGAVFVYTGSGADWDFQQKLIADVPGGFDEFGKDIAIHGDWALVGAPLTDDAGMDSGAVFFFRRDAGVWTLAQRLCGTDTAAGDRFGIAVALDGATAVVGADRHGGTGAAYVFTLEDGTWSETEKLLPSIPSVDHAFGFDVSIDGDRLAVSSTKPFSTPTFDYAYVYRREATWVVEAALQVNNSFESLRVSISGDTLFTAAYVQAFERTGTAWNAEGPSSFERSAVVRGDRALTGNWSSTLIGARLHVREDGVWDSRPMFRPNISTLFEFGREVVLLDDTAFIAAPLKDNSFSDLVARVYVYSILDEPGVPFCTDAPCPCGNDAPGAGCLNSTGAGAVASGAGGRSIADDDLVLTASGFPAGESGLWFMGGDILPPVFVGDGVACTGGLFRFFPSTTSGAGELTLTTPVASAPAGVITPGDTRHFQAWARDVLCGPPPAPCPSPCGNLSNLSSGYSVLFVP